MTRGRRERGFTPLCRSAEHGFTPLCRSAEHGFTPLVRSAEHGFTLIEIMVALAVFSLAVMALVRLESETIRGVSVIDDTAAANLVARNVAVEAVTDAAPPPLGIAAGRQANGGRNWAWTRTVAPTGDSLVLRVDVAVAGPGSNVLARTTLIRPPPRSVQP